MNYHIPVLEQEALALAHEYLGAKEEEFLFVDGTLGDGGHSLSLLKFFPRAKLLAFDRDRVMLARARERLSQNGVSFFSKELDLHEIEEKPELKIFFNSPKASSKGEVEAPKAALFHASYHQLAPFLKKQGLAPRLILLDLGVSLFHLKGAKRGFSYTDETLDMRFDPSEGRSAKDIVNSYPPQKLARILWDFGEESFARHLAKMIVRERPFHSAQELSESIRKALPKRARGKNIHPATRSFQALRIAVNQELKILQSSVKELALRLPPGGLLIIIAFHSLEDRIVKLGFREIGVSQKAGKRKEKMDARTKSPFLILHRRPQRPSMEEVKRNPAARSACLRALFAQRGT